MEIHYTWTSDVPGSDYEIPLQSMQVVEIYLFCNLAGKRTP